MCNNARRIWGVFAWVFLRIANAKIQCEESVSSSTPQNCATTNRIVFEKNTFFQGLSVCSKVIYRLFA